MRHGLHAGGISQILREPVHGYPILPSSPLPPSPADATASGLRNRIEQALARSAEHQAETRAREAVGARLKELTERERDVMQLVVEGIPNKLIADQLDISVRTVEVHRARVFDKMQVKSAVELANLLRTQG
jgi:two-component system response regulator DctR